jgi:hypothetical protein
MRALADVRGASVLDIDVAGPFGRWSPARQPRAGPAAPTSATSSPTDSTIRDGWYG